MIILFRCQLTTMSYSSLNNVKPVSLLNLKAKAGGQFGMKMGDLLSAKLIDHP